MIYLRILGTCLFGLGIAWLAAGIATEELALNMIGAVAIGVGGAMRELT